MHGSQKMQIFQSFTAIFAASAIDISQIRALAHFLIKLPFELRAVPVFHKFTNINATPFGIVFFILSLFSATQFFAKKRPFLFLAVHALSILGCGFFYPPCLPAIIMCHIIYCSCLAFFERIEPWSMTRRIILLSSADLISIAALFPYLRGISGIVAQGTSFFDNDFMTNKFLIYLIVCAPMIIILTLNRKFIISLLGKCTGIILLSSVVSLFFCYIFVHFPESNEYKFLILSQVVLGFLGGAVFWKIFEDKKIITGVILLFVFLQPTFHEIHRKFIWHKNVPLYIREQGSQLLHTDKEQEELYVWVRSSTPVKSVWVDTNALIPVLGQRTLWIYIGKWHEPGLNHKIASLQSSDSKEYEVRKDAAEKIYGIRAKVLDQGTIKYIASIRDLYVVARSMRDIQRFNRLGWREVFHSSAGHIGVYQVL